MAWSTPSCSHRQVDRSSGSGTCSIPRTWIFGFRKTFRCSRVKPSVCWWTYSTHSIRRTSAATIRALVPRRAPIRITHNRDVRALAGACKWDSGTGIDPIVTSTRAGESLGECIRDDCGGGSKYSSRRRALGGCMVVVERLLKSVHERRCSAICRFPRRSVPRHGGSPHFPLVLGNDESTERPRPRPLAHQVLLLSRRDRVWPHGVRR